ncbi:MAG: hypothetical protein HONBIEJF_00134 [Fimbriimonadaceae bacterium]|nr:hypothetical protein [Fimbriimonadaceae bacterium]
MGDPESESTAASVAHTPVTEPATAPAAPADRMPTWLRYGFFALIIIALFAFQSCAAGYSNELVRRETFAKGIDSLSAACVPVMVENNANRMQIFIERIAQQGGLSRVILLDRNLKVVATTDSMASQDVSDIRSAPLKTLVQRRGDRLRATRGIVSAGDTVFGVLVVEWKP